MEVIARFSHNKIDHTKNNTPNLVVSLVAPAQEASAKRPILCVLPLVDLSGSMEGTKLNYAKKSLHKLVDQLQPGDISGLIGFESKAHILIKPQTVTADLKARLHSEIDKLRPLGGTNLWEGLRVSLESLDRLDLSPKYLKRVIVFTDGEPTTGVVDHNEILKFTAEKLGSATVSAFGYGVVGETNFRGMGLKGCDPEFMSKLSQTGKGNYAYVQNPDDALTAFGRELGGLLSTYAQDIRVFLDPQNGHQLTKTLTDLATKVDPLGGLSFEIPEILSEETRHFVFDTAISSQHKAFPRQFTIFNVKVSYSVLNEKGDRETKTLETKAKLRFVETGEEDKEISPELNETIALAQVVRAQLEAEEKAKVGDWAAAQVIMNNTSNVVRARGLIHTAKLAESVGTRLASAVAYVDGSAYLRSVASGVTRGYGTVSMDAAASADLGFMAGTMSNSSMAAYETSFRADEEPVITPNVETVAPLDLTKLWPSRSMLKVQATTHEAKPNESLAWVDPNMVVALETPEE